MSDRLPLNLPTLTQQGQLTDYVKRQQQAAAHYRHKILLTEAETALLLHVSKSFLREHRYSGDQPFYYKLGNSVRYDYCELMEYIEGCRAPSKFDPSKFESLKP